jgi:hypothetical protein
MAPKLVEVSSLGSLVQQANGNYRVRAQVDGKKYQGPWRTTRKQAHADRTKARRATTRTDFVGIVQSLSRGDRPASSSQPQMPLANMLQASKGKGRSKDRGATEHSVHPKAWEICETLNSGGAFIAAVQAPSTLSTKRLRRKTPVPNCASASSSRCGPHSPKAREHLKVGRLRHKPATAAKVPSASGDGVREPAANSVSVMASLLQAATGPPSTQSASHDGHVDNHGHDDVDSHHSHDHDHDEHDGHDHHDVQSPSDEVWERVLGEPLNSFAHEEEL